MIWRVIRTRAGLDLDGRAAPDVLLHLGHALAGHLVGVVRGAHRDLVLDAALPGQQLPALPAWGGRRVGRWATDRKWRNGRGTRR